MTGIGLPFNKKNLHSISNQINELLADCLKGNGLVTVVSAGTVLKNYHCHLLL